MGLTNDPVFQRYSSLVREVGRSTLNTLFPADFESYICSLELVDSEDRTVDLFVFPIMPSNITQTEPSLNNVLKSAGGVTVLSTNTFVPIDIQLQGNFGRRLRILLGKNNVDARAFRFSNAAGVTNKEAFINGALKFIPFHPEIKSGYGCLKILQSIFSKSHGLDSKGNPFRLHFYNPSLGNSYLVKGMNLSLNQTEQSNMIWNYNLQLKAIAPIDTRLRSVDKVTSLVKTMGASIVGKAATITANTLLAELNANTLTKSLTKTVNKSRLSI